MVAAASNTFRANRAVRFSLRDLLIAVAGLSIFLTSLLEIGTLTASSVAAAIGVYIFLRGRRSRNRWALGAGALLFMASFAICGFILALRILFEEGPIYSASQWPHDLERMVKIAGVSPSDVKADCIYSFFDSEYVWRLRITPSKLDEVTSEFQLCEIGTSKVPRQFLRAFPIWWRPGRGESDRYLSTPDFPVRGRGPDGDHYFAMYDVHNQFLYVWYKLGF
jgi:hypothetical protein